MRETGGFLLFEWVIEKRVGQQALSCVACSFAEQLAHSLK